MVSPTKSSPHWHLPKYILHVGYKFFSFKRSKELNLLVFQLIANPNWLLVNSWDFRMKSFNLASFFWQKSNFSNKSGGLTSKKYEGIINSYSLFCCTVFCWLLNSLIKLLMNGNGKSTFYEFVPNKFDLFFEVSENLFSKMEIFFDTLSFLSLKLSSIFFFLLLKMSSTYLR